MAPAAKAKAANGAPSKGKQQKAKTADVESTASGATTPAAAANGKPLSAEDVAKDTESSRGRPDKAAYDAEQQKLRAEIDTKQAEKV